MSFQSLMNLVYQAMLPEFTVFGVSTNLWSFFVFSVVFTIIAWFIHEFWGKW